MALSKAELTAADTALTAANGNFAIAAEALGMDEKALRQRVTQNHFLAARWRRVKDEPAPTQEQTLARTSPVTTTPIAPVLQSEAILAAQIAKEDAKFKKGLSGLGFNSEELEYATKLQSFYGEHYSKCGDVLRGGLTVVGVRVMLLAQNVHDRIITAPVIAKLTGDERDKALIEQRMLFSQFHRLCENLIKMSEAADNSSVIRAKIDLWKQQAKDAQSKPKPGRAGFTPLLAVKADHLHINEKPAA